MPSREEMYSAYRAQALRQWIVDVEPSADTPSLIYLRGHSPANGTRYGFVLGKTEGVPSRIQPIRNLKGVQRIDEGFYTSVVYCAPERRDALVEEIRARLRAEGFLSTAEWEATAPSGATEDPRPRSRFKR